MNPSQRKSLRLKNYDYSQNGFYFITICIQNKECLLGEIIDQKMILNHAGMMIDTIWHEIPKYYEGFKVHEFIVMPNHIHGIIEISSHNESKGGHRGPPLQGFHGRTWESSPTLSDVMQRFKTMTTNKYIYGVKNYDWKRFHKQLWQRSYYEHIIRNEKTLEEIQTYIINNPINWDKDSLYTI